MTLDEAIKNAEEVAIEEDKLCKRSDDASGYSRSHNEEIRTSYAKNCEKRADEHRQLAEWLKELKQLKEQTEWIPVSEKLPEPFMYVNATCRSLVDDRENWVVETIYLPIPIKVNKHGYSDWGNIPMLNRGEAEVIAWVERIIPQPYKAESEDGEEFEKDFNEILNMAVKTLDQEIIYKLTESKLKNPKTKTFDILRFVADNAGLSIFEAIEKAYHMGVSEQECILSKMLLYNFSIRMSTIYT